MEYLNLESFFALVSLTGLEMILGFDNIVMLSLMVNRLPPEQREVARKLGLALALIFRIGLLFSISFIMLLTEPWFKFQGVEFSGRNIILIVGGLFLIAKATFELHDAAEGTHHVPLPDDDNVAEGRAGGTVSKSGKKKHKRKRQIFSSFGGVIAQIALLDIVFSLDSVITAVGMAQHLPIMVIAIIIAIVLMLEFSRG